MNIGHQLSKSTGQFLTILLFLYACIASAAIPTTITYQGYLTDTNGAPETSTPSAYFQLYTQPSGGSAAWGEGYTLDVINGFFRVDLGSQIPFPADLFTSPVYLGISIGSDLEMTPRLRFSSVPTAFVAAGSAACSSGETNCDGSCTNLQTDLDNCGTCGTACNIGASEVCVAGACGPDPDADADGFTVVAGGDCDDNDPNINPGADELCNGLDDDCDLAIDEDIPNPQPCSLQTGVCNGATASCGGAGGWNACTEADYGQNYEVTELTCDGLDNNCDGQTDEAFDLSTDLDNCGSCGNACNGTPNQCFQAVCSGGVCANSIDDGTFCNTGVSGECFAEDACQSGSCLDGGFASSGTACSGGVCDGAGQCIPD